MQVSAFFSERIPAEERKLVQMFGVEYAQYAAKTPILIPGVVGYAQRKAYAAATHGVSPRTSPTRQPEVKAQRVAAASSAARAQT